MCRHRWSAVPGFGVAQVQAEHDADPRLPSQFAPFPFCTLQSMVGATLGCTSMGHQNVTLRGANSLSERAQDIPCTPELPAHAIPQVRPVTPIPLNPTYTRHAVMLCGFCKVGIDFVHRTCPSTSSAIICAHERYQAVNTQRSLFLPSPECILLRNATLLHI
jgi:hypothetical protein